MSQLSKSSALVQSVVRSLIWVVLFMTCNKYIVYTCLACIEVSSPARPVRQYQDNQLNVNVLVLYSRTQAYPCFFFFSAPNGRPGWFGDDVSATTSTNHGRNGYRRVITTSPNRPGLPFLVCIEQHVNKA